MDEPQANRTHKASAFSLLFSNKKNLVEVYNAINGTNYPEMPLRMLMYMGREYERITNSRDLYRENKIRIPTPEFIVLYNGRKEFPDFKQKPYLERLWGVCCRDKREPEDNEPQCSNKNSSKGLYSQEYFTIFS
jgi:hypothetical protein